MNLRTPGPTPCPPEVLEAMGRQMTDHRGPETAAAIKRVAAGLRRAFATEQPVLIFTCSGTGGLEAAVCNVLSPGDKVLAISIGNFGDRFASTAKAFGTDVAKLSFEPGQAADPEAVRQALAENCDVRAVLVTHNETSTSVTNPLQEIAAVVRSHSDDTLLLVDAISSMGSVPVQTDAWGLDVVVSGSQKGWMVPPGLAFMSMSERAWRTSEKATAPRYYFDAARARDAQEKGQTPWTPAVSLIFAMDVALDLLEREGWANVWARHERVAAHTRRGVADLGLSFVADERFASNTVTAVWMPEGVDVSALRKTMREEHGVTLAGGQGSLTGKIVRIGHLGMVDESDIDEALAALGRALASSGYRTAAKV